jgi:hypothetical protein
MKTWRVWGMESVRVYTLVEAETAEEALREAEVADYLEWHSDESEGIEVGMLEDVEEV